MKKLVLLIILTIFASQSIMTGIMVQQNLNNILNDKTKGNPMASLLNLLSEHGGQTISEL